MVWILRHCSIVDFLLQAVIIAVKLFHVKSYSVGNTQRAIKEMLVNVAKFEIGIQDIFACIFLTRFP